ncbi:MAG: [Kiritimatiellae bacterium]|nr:[FeFe] hydrogenase H-cluster radical SAM maturase HydG [Kiritimatiellia bacterium]MBR5587717.1 [FeFe] hydrogenase H-cluster radical SAM maturase HydG [Kiritimatiellia bacterium]
MNTTLSADAVDFIDDVKLETMVAGLKEDPEAVRRVIAKSLRKEALSVEETAILLGAESPELVEEIFEAARSLKRDVYGNRIVFFAPLYVGNYCTNNCKYCGFRSSLTSAVRHTLSDEELVREVEALEDLGHKRLILVYGESPKYSPEFIAHTVRKTYATKKGNGEIRRVNINAAPLDEEGFRIVKDAGIGTYQIFQETYHKRTYAEWHPANTMKGNYMWRLNAFDRAFRAGIDDMGLGVLFGLYDWRFEVLAMVTHALYLQQKFGVGPHTLSFPRIKAAEGLDLNLKYQVSDDEYKRLVAILRLAVPYTGLIMTAREPAELRREVLAFGVSQIDAGTKLEIGSYQEQRKDGEQNLKREQFKVGDTRSLDEVIGEILEGGYIPSFCTSCYRLGRTGEHFMEYAIPGFIGKFCTPNAIMTLAEYLEDYASPETKAKGEALIAAEVAKLDERLRNEVLKRLEQVRSGKRDLYF